MELLRSTNRSTLPKGSIASNNSAAIHLRFGFRFLASECNFRNYCSTTSQEDWSIIPSLIFGLSSVLTDNWSYQNSLSLIFRWPICYLPPWHCWWWLPWSAPSRSSSSRCWPSGRSPAGPRCSSSTLSPSHTSAHTRDWTSSRSRSVYLSHPKSIKCILLCQYVN